MEKTTDSTTEALRAAAHAGVEALEGLPEGEAPAGAANRAFFDGILEFRDPSMRAMFPAYVRGRADMLATFEFGEANGWTRDRFPEHVAALHDAARDSDPDFAAWLRSGLVVDRIAAVGAAVAPTRAMTPEQSADDYVERYTRQIAFQLVGVPEFEPHASILATEVPALMDRVRACQARHDAHRGAELARVRQEQEAAAKEQADAQRARRDAIGGFFAARGGQRFIVRDRVFSGMGLSDMARGRGTRDHELGEFGVFASLDELEALMKRTQAGDAVAV